MGERKRERGRERKGGRERGREGEREGVGERKRERGREGVGEERTGGDRSITHTSLPIVLSLCSAKLKIRSTVSS